MSDDDFDVHGPHDHELEHAAASAAHDRFASRIAMTTALLAVLAAICSYLAGATQATAALDKNNAVIRKTEAGDQWAYYQAKSTRQSLMELGAILASPDKTAVLQAERDRYAREKSAIQDQARKLESESDAWDRRSEEQMHVHHRWAQATTALQVAIAMSAIALITRRRWMQVMVYGFAGLGLAVGALALLQV